MNDKISEYIENQDPKQKVALIAIRNVIKRLLPDAEERLSYGVPSFRYQGKTIMYAAFKNHIGIYPEPDLIEFFKNELGKYTTRKGTIQFNLNEPIPYDLIEKIVIHKYGL